MSVNHPEALISQEILWFIPCSTLLAPGIANTSGTTGLQGEMVVMVWKGNKLTSVMERSMHRYDVGGARVTWSCVWQELADTSPRLASSSFRERSQDSWRRVRGGGVHEVISTQTTAEPPQTKIGQRASLTGPLQLEHHPILPFNPSPLPWYDNDGQSAALIPFKHLRHVRYVQINTGVSAGRGHVWIWNMLL